MSEVKEALKVASDFIHLHHERSDAEADQVLWILAAALVTLGAPIPMLLFCPKCGVQHVDEAEVKTAPAYGLGGGVIGERRVVAWDNPPHRSHLCGACGCIWRPADVATTGVARIETSGKADNWTAALPVSTSQGVGDDLESTSQSLRSAPSFALPEQWRDISTAPKDGSAIDLWVDWPEFDNGFGVSPAHGSRWPAARWVDGDWYDGQFSLHQYSAKPSALHWMPMPSPPKSHAEEG
jgi:hypothetical protein